MLSAEAAAQVRAALLAPLQEGGGGLSPEDDSVLSPGVGPQQPEVERCLRAAYRLLDAKLPAA